jgi:hypothetical protein
VTPVGDFLQGRVAMVKDFGPEAQQAVNANTQAAFSNYGIRFIKPDVAVADALLTMRNVNGPARAFRGRAAFEHDQVLGVSKLA